MFPLPPGPRLLAAGDAGVQWRHQAQARVLRESGVEEEIRELQDRLRMYGFMLEDCAQAAAEKRSAAAPDTLLHSALWKAGVGVLLLLVIFASSTLMKSMSGVYFFSMLLGTSFAVIALLVLVVLL
jgi:hypothetical protein